MEIKMTETQVIAEANSQLESKYANYINDTLIGDVIDRASAAGRPLDDSVVAEAVKHVVEVRGVEADRDLATDQLSYAGKIRQSWIETIRSMQGRFLADMAKIAEKAGQPIAPTKLQSVLAKVQADIVAAITIVESKSDKSLINFDDTNAVCDDLTADAMYQETRSGKLVNFVQRRIGNI